MRQFKSPISWLLLLWLAVAPVLFDAHELTHLSDQTADEGGSCVLAQLAERDDDGLVPTDLRAGLAAASRGPTDEAVMEALRGDALGRAAIRGPPGA